MDKDGDTRNKHGHTAAKPGKGSIPAGVVIALYCNEKGDVQIQEVITPEIIADRVLECAYPPVPAPGYDDDDDDDEDGKGGGKRHGPKPRIVCPSGCFPCKGPTGQWCCCNCPP
jgi:hypothetical protein